MKKIPVLILLIFILFSTNACFRKVNFYTQDEIFEQKIEYEEIIINLLEEYKGEVVYNGYKELGITRYNKYIVCEEQEFTIAFGGTLIIDSNLYRQKFNVVYKKMIDSSVDYNIELLTDVVNIFSPVKKNYLFYLNFIQKCRIEYKNSELSSIKKWKGLNFWEDAIIRYEIKDGYEVIEVHSM